MIIVESRASVVLYNYLVSNRPAKPILLPANVCPIVPATFHKAKTAFHFVDIDESHAMNKEHAYQHLKSDQYGGLLFVHAYGKQFNNTDFYAAVKKLSDALIIIDDRCLCIPSVFEQANQISDLQLFSTGYSKFVELGTWGYGFISRGNYERNKLVYSESDYAALMNQFKVSIKGRKKFHYKEGSWLDSEPNIDNVDNYLHEIKEKIPEIKKHKESINQIYQDKLPKVIQYPDTYHNWRFNIRVDNPETLIDAITDAGLFAGRNYPSLSTIFGNKNCPVAQFEGEQIVNLFNDFRFDEKMAVKLSQVILDVLHTG